MVLPEINNAVTMLTYWASFEYNRNGNKQRQQETADCLQRALPPDP